MTRRTEFEHRAVELKAKIMARVANRLFTFREDGLDGFVKRRLGGGGKGTKRAAESAHVD